ncbi:MAG: ATP-binding protein [Ruminococcaceae bacterium]|nr:ATP-binding protein [Oscillospiraceae bacterium]
MLYTEQNVKDNIRNREGKRVFFLGKGDQLTSGARDFLRRERIEIRPGESAKIEVYRLLDGSEIREKPEHMTHLHGDVLVRKTHPRIAFRGAVDMLEAELMLCQLNVPEFRKELGEILALSRNLIRCEVLGEPVTEEKLCGLMEQEIRKRSHLPQDFYGQPHFMPEYTDGMEILLLNRCRCEARNAELAAARAFIDEDGKVTRGDILKAMNRMSSMLYLLMIRLKSGQKSKG